MNCEIADLRCFRVWQKAAADHFTKHKYLAHAVGVYGLIMLISVLNGDQSFRKGVKAGFLPDLLDRIRPNGFQHVYPTARQGSCAVIFMNEQYFITLEDGGARIKLRGLITCFVTKQILYFFNGIIGFHTQHLRRNLTQAFISFGIKRIV